jgi:hypothetical protein
MNTIRKPIRRRKAWEQMRDRVFELRMDRIFKAGPLASVSYIPQRNALAPESATAVRPEVQKANHPGNRWKSEGRGMHCYPYIRSYIPTFGQSLRSN